MLRVLRSSAPRFFTTTSLPRRRFSSIADFDPFQKVQIPRTCVFSRNPMTTFDGYVFGKHDAPGIIVLEDWFGVDHHVKSHALKISELGFKVLIPNLYRLGSIFTGIKWGDTKADVYSAADWLKTNGSEKVGAMGFSKGGALAISSADYNTPLNAVVAFYGVPVNIGSIFKFGCPIQAHFGKLDEFVGLADVEAIGYLKYQLKASEALYEVYEYDGQRHEFMNGSAEGIERQISMGIPKEDIAAKRLAWERAEKWMTKYLLS